MTVTSRQDHKCRHHLWCIRRKVVTKYYIAGLKRSTNRHCTPKVQLFNL
nr:MAG TPA: hypothetical protein [Bacteriophage sp.]